MSTDVDWVAEPPKAKSTWRTKSDALRERPGEWAKVAEASNSSTAANLRRGYLQGWTAGEFEVRPIAIGKVDGQPRYDIYARFTGGPT